MNNNEYIYILINASFKDVVKIGKTTRTPEERAIELSSSTGVPTPFVVAYEEIVPNCHIAERLIHEALENNGYRVSDVREFFSIPLKQAIQVVAQISEFVRNNYADTANDCKNDQSEDLGSVYYEKGNDAYQGRGNVLQDFGEAAEYYKKAIEFGNTEAYFWLGHMYSIGQGVPKSFDKAIKIFKEGVNKGDADCCIGLFLAYLKTAHLDNAEKSFSLYLEQPSIKIDDFLVYLKNLYWFNRNNGDTFLNIKDIPGKFSQRCLSSLIKYLRGQLQLLLISKTVGIKQAKEQGVQLLLCEQELNQLDNKAWGMDFSGFEEFLFEKCWAVSLSEFEEFLSENKFKDAQETLRQVFSGFTVDELTLIGVDKIVKHPLSRYMSQRLPVTELPTDSQIDNVSRKGLFSRVAKWFAD